MIMRDKTVQARAGRPTPSRTRSRRRRYLVALGFILPAALYIVVFFGYPLVYNLAMSFQDYTPRSFYTGEAPFVGLDNYRKILSSPIFQPAVLHTIVFTVGSIVFQFGIGLALAVYFNPVSYTHLRAHETV